jgi:hypothetical protein
VETRSPSIWTRFHADAAVTAASVGLHLISSFIGVT